MISTAADLLAGIADWTLYLGLCGAGICLSIAWHELGHAVGAYITRCRIFEIVLGASPRFEKWIRGTRLRISMFPLEGYVVSLPRSSRLYRLRKFVMIGFGPAFSGCYLAGLLWTSGFAAETDRPALNRAVTLLTILELGMICTTLWPARVTVAGMNTGSDGLQLWQTLTGSAPTREEYERQFACLEVGSLQARGLSEEMQPWIDQISATHLETLSLEERHHWSAVFIGLEQWDIGRDMAAEILSDPKCERGARFRSEVTDTFASAVIYGLDRNSIPKAIELLQESISDFPELITLKGTLGGLLFELQRFDEAESLLKEVVQKSSADIDHGISSAFLALLAARRGQFEEARKLAQIATEKSGTMPVVKRALAGLDAIRHSPKV